MPVEEPESTFNLHCRKLIEKMLVLYNMVDFNCARVPVQVQRNLLLDECNPVLVGILTFQQLTTLRIILIQYDEAIYPVQREIAILPIRRSTIKL